MRENINIIASPDTFSHKSRMATGTFPYPFSLLQRPALEHGILRKTV